METVLSYADKVLLIRWLNLLVGLWELYYYVNGASLFLLILAILNIGVFSMWKGYLK